MKLGRVTKHDKRNKKSQKNDDDVMPANYDVIIIFTLYGPFGAIQKAYSGCIDYKT